MEGRVNVPNQDYATFEYYHRKAKEQALTTIKNECRGWDDIYIYYVDQDKKTWRYNIKVVSTMTKELDEEYYQFKRLYEWYVRIHGFSMILREYDRWDERNKYITSLRVASGSGEGLSRFEVVGFNLLKEIIIEDNCFVNTSYFKLDELSRLEKLVVGKKSFTSGEYVNKLFYTDRHFYVMNCPLLKLIDIGDCSFAEYGGEWKLSGLEKLEKLRIMSDHEESYNFNGSSFVVIGE